MFLFQGIRWLQCRGVFTAGRLAMWAGHSHPLPSGWSDHVRVAETLSRSRGGDFITDFKMFTFKVLVAMVLLEGLDDSHLLLSPWPGLLSLDGCLKKLFPRPKQ